MPRRVPDLGREIADDDAVPLPGRLVGSRHLGAGLLGRDHAAAEPLLEAGDALDVVGVAVRDEDVGEAPAGLVQRLQDRRLLGASIAAQASVAGSRMRNPILSSRQRKTWMSAGI
jgi:hypothetical protein